MFNLAIYKNFTGLVPDYNTGTFKRRGKPYWIKNRKRVNIKKIYRKLKAGNDVTIVDLDNYIWEGYKPQTHIYFATNRPAIEVV